MEIEVKQKKQKRHKRRKGSPATLTLRRIPGEVHEFMHSYKRKISDVRGRDYNIKQAYVEYLIESTKSAIA